MENRPSRTALGRAGEEAAATFLEENGYQILRRNVRFRSGEIDLVAKHGEVLVFIEVKTRTGITFGTAAEAVTPTKQRQLVRLAAQYLANAGGEPRSCRFDVVAVEPTGPGQWRCSVIRDAFSAR